MAHQSLRYFHSPYSTLEGVEPEIVSIFKLHHKYKVIEGHERGPIVVFAGRPHHLRCQNSKSLFFKYALVWSQVKLRVFLYSLCLAYKEVRPAGDKNKKKK